jgi:hypothetical protein
VPAFVHRCRMACQRGRTRRKLLSLTNESNSAYGNDIDPNYAVVFPSGYSAGAVSTITSTVAPRRGDCKGAHLRQVSAPYAARQISSAEYDDAVQEIVDFVEQRATDIEDFFARQE